MLRMFSRVRRSSSESDAQQSRMNLGSRSVRGAIVSPTVASMMRSTSWMTSFKRACSRHCAVVRGAVAPPSSYATKRFTMVVQRVQMRARRSSVSFPRACGIHLGGITAATSSGSVHRSSASMNASSFSSQTTCSQSSRGFTGFFISLTAAASQPSKRPPTMRDGSRAVAHGPTSEASSGSTSCSRHCIALARSGSCGRVLAKLPSIVLGVPEK
mmetsp:Transcript_17582/g.54504  ORF Transcript_17582/g.54504 Transcript_17582/m.54504 type:complete len:214 (-) Transcript_17582:32-673(-)